MARQRTRRPLPEPVDRPEGEGHLTDDEANESITELTNEIIGNVQWRRTVGFCDPCAARAMALAASRIGQLHGVSVEELVEIVRNGYAMSAANPVRPEGPLH
jgi:hypothetical protein